MAAKDSTSKKRSATSAAWRRQPDQPTFFIDRCLGAIDVPNALRAAGLIVEVHKDHFNSDVEDQAWLAAVGRKQWIVLTKDRSFARRPMEIAALIQADVAAFVLASANTTGPDNAAAIVSAIPQVLAVIQHNPRPFIAQITASGKVSMVLTHSGLLRRLQ